MAGGFSETFASVQLTVITGILAIILLWPGLNKKGLILLVMIAIIGAIASTLLIIVAPGNIVRAAGQPERLSLSMLMARTLLDFKIFTSRALNQELIVLFLVGFIPAWMMLIRIDPFQGQLRSIKRSLIAILIVIPVFTSILIMSAIVPYEYGISSYPDDRVLVIARALLYMAIGVWSLGIGALVSEYVTIASRSWLWASILVSFLLIVLGMNVVYQEINSSSTQLDQLRDFAESWDERHNHLQEAYRIGADKVEARSLTHMGQLAEIGYDPNEWINRCVAQTYGLELVIAK
jgi:hypothetical protein